MVDGCRPIDDEMLSRRSTSGATAASTVRLVAALLMIRSCRALLVIPTAKRTAISGFLPLRYYVTFPVSHTPINTSRRYLSHFCSRSIIKMNEEQATGEVGAAAASDEATSPRKSTRRGRRRRGGRRNKSAPGAVDVGQEDSKDASNNQKKGGGGGGGRRVPNSYLKIIMDDAALGTMHNMAQIIRDAVRDKFELPVVEEMEEEEDLGTAKLLETDAAKSEGGTSMDANKETSAASGDVGNPRDGGEQVDKRAKDCNGGPAAATEQQEKKLKTDQGKSNQERKRSKRPLTFKPRSRKGLHMTFFFGGTILCELPVEELQEWHGKIMRRFEEAKASNNIDSGANDEETQQQQQEQRQDQCEADGYTLQFKELCLFPPRRNTLIVAIFEASPALHRLHDDIRDIAKNGESELLASVVQRSKEKWTAHVTIGDLFGGVSKKADLKELAALLSDGLGMTALKVTDPEATAEEEQVEAEESPAPLPSFTARVRGVTMGGPVPEQVELDWDYYFFDEPAQKGTEEE